MEVYVEAYGENILEGSGRKLAYKAFLTFVAVDQMGNPINVPKLEPKTEKEIMLFDGALRRRQLRLVLAERMKPEDATELKSLFFKINPEGE
ncbi:MAG: acyl-CoA thioesterase, partial [Bacteroidetes bacterium]|nr:acyl-CoA thioesterase [Bacteroidota bacterium]